MTETPHTPIRSDALDPLDASRGAEEPPGSLRLRPPRHRVARRAVVWWILRSLVLAMPLLAGLGVAYAAWAPARPWLVVPMAVVAVLGAIGVSVEPWWRYVVHRWEISDDATYAVTGWIVREWRVAPTSRIQTVDAVRGPLEQLLRLATLRVTTASSHGAIEIGGLDAEVAEQAAMRLASVAELTPGDAT